MEPEIMLWDIDGVLIDVSQSYRQAIVDSVQYYFSNFIGLKLEKNLVSAGDTQAFKLAGGFNDDWELTYALVLCYLSKMLSVSGLEAADSSVPEGFDPMVARLRELGESTEGCSLAVNLAQVAEKIKAEGGGPPAAEKVLSRQFPKGYPKAKSYYFPALIKRVFEEKYLGGDLFSKKYGEKPLFYSGSGLIRKEIPLTDLGTLLNLRRRYYFGVVTGRDRFEAEFSLKLHGFAKIFPSELMVAGGETKEKKPSAQPLLECRRRVCARHKLSDKTPAFYVGDSVDDLTAARNAEFYFVGVVGGIPGEENRERTRTILHNKISDLLVDTIDELLVYL